mmetsp:Transcript_101539/g.315821  ORF Transcript_101539/g.315821 Transcript_101539/m.315821 type:complete len:218 (-) Transcript_101539:45-698(-)
MPSSRSTASSAATAGDRGSHRRKAATTARPVPLCATTSSSDTSRPTGPPAAGSAASTGSRGARPSTTFSHRASKRCTLATGTRMTRWASPAGTEAPLGLNSRAGGSWQAPACEHLACPPCFPPSACAGKTSMGPATVISRDSPASSSGPKEAGTCKINLSTTQLLSTPMLSSSDSMQMTSSASDRCCKDTGENGEAAAVRLVGMEQCSAMRFMHRWQ